MTVRALPCYPCPHGSACCAYGVDLTESEAAALDPGKVYRTSSGTWRTRVRNRRCVFLADNACTLHETDHYPATCRGFPWYMGDQTTPYEYDRTICPELVPVQLLVRKAARS